MESVGVKRKEGAANRHPPATFFVRESLLRVGDVLLVVLPGGRQLLRELYVWRLAAVEAVRSMVIIVFFIVCI